MKFSKEEVLAKASPYLADIQQFEKDCPESIELLRNGYWSKVLEFTPKQEEGKDKKPPYRAKLMLNRMEKGIKPFFRFFKEKLDIANQLKYNGGIITLLEAHKEQLKRGSLLLVEADFNGEKKGVFIQNDKDVNQLCFSMQEWFKPTSIYKVELTKEQKSELLEGKKIDFDMPIKDGTKAMKVQFSPVTGAYSFVEAAQATPKQEVAKSLGATHIFKKAKELEKAVKENLPKVEIKGKGNVKQRHKTLKPLG